MPELGIANKEQSTSYEPLSEEDFIKLLNGTGNHEIKLLTTAILASSHDEWFSRTKLHTELMRIQGVPVAWEINRLTPSNYCDHSLGPIGAVVIDEIQGKRGLIHSFKASEFGRTYGLALAGTLLEWSLENPQLSLQTVLGSTASRGQVRSPEVRYMILSELATNPNEEISFVDVKKELGLSSYSYNNIANHLREMANQGLIDQKSNLDEYNPIFTIEKPSYQHWYRELPDTSITTRAIYTGLQELFKSGTAEASLYEIVEACSGAMPEVDIQQIYYKLVKTAAKNSTSLPAIRLTDRNGAPVKKTTVRLNDETAPVILDLLERFEELKEGKALNRLGDKALTILANPTKCYILFDKAKQTSVRYAASQETREDTYQRIINVVRELGHISSAEIRVELKNRGHNMNLLSVRAAAGELATEGRLIATQARRKSTHLKKLNLYSVPERADL